MEENNLQAEKQTRAERADRIRSRVVWTIFFAVMASFIISGYHYDGQRILDDQAAMKQNFSAMIVQWKQDVAELETALQNGEAPKGDMTREEYQKSLASLRDLISQAEKFPQRVDNSSTGYTWYNQKGELQRDWSGIAIEFDTLRAQMHS